MSANSKRKRHLKWLKKQEVRKEREHAPAVSSSRYNLAQTIPDTRGTTPVRISGGQTFANRIVWPDRSNAEQNIYVSPSGNDETGDGSVDHPFLTMQRAVMVPGISTVHVVPAPEPEPEPEPQTTRLRPIHQPLYDTAAIDPTRTTVDMQPWIDVVPVYIPMRVYRLMSEFGISRDNEAKFIEDLILAEKERRNPPKSEIVGPAIRRIDLDD